MSKVIDFLDDNHIPYKTSGNHHCRPGWVQICCPFCLGGDSNYHLGINLNEGYCNCYKCGYHSTISVFSELLGTKRVETGRIILGLFDNLKTKTPDLSKISLRPKAVNLPGNGSMTLFAYEYLIRRFGEEADRVIETYKLSSTLPCYKHEIWSPTGSTFTDRYANCIVIPNYLQNQIVSFQCNNYFKRQYITASPQEEMIPCKSFLWGIDLVPADTVIVCEAAYDAMAVGAGAVHTHGCGYTREQVQEMATFEQVYIAYDMDRAGESAAKKLMNQLSHKTKVSRVKFSSGKDLNDLLYSPRGREELAEIKELLK